MKLLRVGEPGSEVPVAIGPDGVPRAISPITSDIDGEFLASGGIDRVREALSTNSLEHITIDGLRIGAPIARPSAVICIGMNYAAHAAESGN